MPLVFQNLDLEALKLQDGQREGIEELRQTFLAELAEQIRTPTIRHTMNAGKKPIRRGSMLPA